MLPYRYINMYVIYNLNNFTQLISQRDTHPESLGEHSMLWYYHKTCNEVVVTPTTQPTRTSRFESESDSGDGGNIYFCYNYIPVISQSLHRPL